MSQTVGRAKPAAPHLPASMATVDIASDGLSEETQWWQHELTGEALGTVADNFEIEQCRLSRVDFSNGHWERGQWRNCEVRDSNFANVQAEQCLIQRSTFHTVRGTGLQWADGTIKDVTFDGCRLDLSGFRFTTMSHIIFSGCRLSGVDLTNAKMSNILFDHCDLTGAKLDHASMAGCQLTECSLDGISGIEALRGARVTSSDLMSLTYSLAAACGIIIDHPGKDA